MARELSAFETKELLRWFLYRMRMEDRQELMTTYPRHYSRLFPKVSKETLALKLAAKLEWQEQNEANPTPDSKPVL